MTDLFQGMMLLATGAILLWLGIDYMGDFETFWSHLPRGHRTAFTNFHTDPSYHSVGLFWQDGNQHRHVPVPEPGHGDALLSARSVKDSRRAS